MREIESFATMPLQNVIPSYLYLEYSDDEDLQAFVNSQNALAQGYLEWFKQAPLGLYTAPGISGPLLDWTANGIYGIPRPVLATQNSVTIAGYNTRPYDTIAYNAMEHTESGSSGVANDDIYKRVITWNLYRGDGQFFTMGWLKNRISRFLNGPNGADYPVLDDPPSITVSGTVFTVTANDSQAYSDFQLCYANNALSFPFQYSLAFLTVYFLNDGGVLQATLALNYPTNPAGLAAGSIWYNGGTFAIVPGITPDPAAPPVYYNDITPDELLALGGGNFPLTNPNNPNQLWNNGLMICIS